MNKEILKNIGEITYEFVRVNMFNVRLTTALIAVFTVTYGAGIIESLLRPDTQPATPLTYPLSDATARRLREPLSESTQFLTGNSALFRWRASLPDGLDVFISDFGEDGRICTAVQQTPSRFLPDFRAASIDILEENEQRTSRYMLTVGTSVWALLEGGPVEIGANTTNYLGQVEERTQVSPGMFVLESNLDEVRVLCVGQNRPVTGYWSLPAG